MAVIDVKRLSSIDRVVVGASLVALIAMFLPWTIQLDVRRCLVSGFGSGYGWFWRTAGDRGRGLSGLIRSGSSVPKTSMGPGVIVLGASAIGTALVVIRWISLPSGSGTSGRAVPTLSSPARWPHHHPDRRPRPGGLLIPSVQEIR